MNFAVVLIASCWIGKLVFETQDHENFSGKQTELFLASFGIINYITIFLLGFLNYMDLANDYR